MSHRGMEANIWSMGQRKSHREDREDREDREEREGGYKVKGRG